MGNNQNERSQCFVSGCILLKLVTTVVCLVGFIFNSYAIFDQFVGGKTLLSSDIQPSANDKLTFPAIVICNSVAFKTRKLSSNLSDYIDNTLKLKEFFADWHLMSVTSDGTIEAVDIDQEFKPIYTAYYGTCYCLNTRFEVGRFVQRYPFKISLFQNFD